MHDRELLHRCAWLKGSAAPVDRHLEGAGLPITMTLAATSFGMGLVDAAIHFALNFCGFSNGRALEANTSIVRVLTRVVEQLDGEPRPMLRCTQYLRHGSLVILITLDVLDVFNQVTVGLDDLLTAVADDVGYDVDGRHLVVRMIEPHPAPPVELTG